MNSSRACRTRAASPEPNPSPSPKPIPSPSPSPSPNPSPNPNPNPIPNAGGSPLAGLECTAELRRRLDALEGVRLGRRALLARCSEMQGLTREVQLEKLTLALEAQPSPHFQAQP
jgi:hypothetical protein